MLGICSFSVLESCMKHCLYLFLCMAVRQCYGKRRDLEFGLLRWTTSEDCWVSGGWIVPNAQIRELCSEKGLDETIDKGALRWNGHVERMERDRIAKRVYVGHGRDELIP